MNNKLFEIDTAPCDLSNEWYTPVKYIDAAREVLERIDLDPASCEQANQTVRAAHYYTREQNGLLQPWYGRVWLNPPFGTTGMNNHTLNIRTGDSNIKLFIRKLVASYQEGQIEQAILLSRADPSAYWFPILWNYPICFVGHNFYFDGPRGKGTVKHHFGTCFVYFGPNEATFIDVFSRFGRIARAVDQPHPISKQSELWDTEAAS